MIGNIESNGFSDCFREREHAIGCALACATREEASVHRQIHSGHKEKFKRFYEGALPVSACERATDCVLSFSKPIKDAVTFDVSNPV